MEQPDGLGMLERTLVDSFVSKERKELLSQIHALRVHNEQLNTELKLKAEEVERMEVKSDSFREKAKQKLLQAKETIAKERGNGLILANHIQELEEACGRREEELRRALEDEKARRRAVASKLAEEEALREREEEAFAQREARLHDQIKQLQIELRMASHTQHQLPSSSSSGVREDELRLLANEVRALVRENGAMFDRLYDLKSQKELSMQRSFLLGGSENEEKEYDGYGVRDIPLLLDVIAKGEEIEMELVQEVERLQAVVMKQSRLYQASPIQLSPTLDHHTHHNPYLESEGEDSLDRELMGSLFDSFSVLSPTKTKN